ncbi:MAG: glycosyltransferase [Leptospiraceae bacterium]|nr:glycosyltransferase [Leptospiraceae bacterium]MCP5502184.1 glycosyltransferase [Leptospiraceae bacterium]
MNLLKPIEINQSLSLKDYLSIPFLTAPIQELIEDARQKKDPLHNRTIWMISQSDRGEGVSELLSRKVCLFKDLGFHVRWLSISEENKDFLALNNRLRNLIYGRNENTIQESERILYESINLKIAKELSLLFKQNDILIIHDTAAMATPHFISKKYQIKFIWRCHAGTDIENEFTRNAWEFLKPYSEHYNTTIFSAPEYIPYYFSGRAQIISPSIDPLSHKNRDLSIHKLIGILCNAGLSVAHNPIITPEFNNIALRLQKNRTYAPAKFPDEIGLLYRPIISQISRWEKMKGFLPLLEAFKILKQEYRDKAQTERQQKRIDFVRMVLAGPAPEETPDRPISSSFLKEVEDSYLTLPEDIQRDIAIIKLPLQSVKENALMINALQRCSTLVVQNSLQEAFGLTCTEAMWKSTPVLVSNSCGLRQQVRDKLDGWVLNRADDPKEIAKAFYHILDNPKERERLALSAQKRVMEEFLIFTNLRKWLRTFSLLSSETQT